MSQILKFQFSQTQGKLLIRLIHLKILKFIQFFLVTIANAILNKRNKENVGGLI